ncbi:MAG TPA: S41 family peptidase [Candidatus Gastranaerophilales bacterium]|nr:S41 family peptidase [Candidatus Gastranaerophilales bacterium]
MKNIKKSIYIAVLAIIILIGAGYYQDRYKSRSVAEYIVSTAENYDKTPQGVYNKAWRIIKNNFVDESYNNQDWKKWKTRYKAQIKTDEDLRVATESMLASLNDPYTRFLPKDDFEEQHRNIDSRLRGIGVHITEADGNIIVVSVIEDTPAKKYGLKQKDQILKVDKISTKGLPLKDVAELIRGEEGSVVVLTILRDEKTIVKKIAREEIKIKTVKYEMLDKNIAYIRILSFISNDTHNEFKKALYATKSSDGIIVDVRGNFGGLLTNAVYITNMFLKTGNIVSIVDKDENKQDYPADLSMFITQKPVVILTDESSASASEIFSGAMKDHKKAVLVGKKTFGKGRVQMVTELPDGSGVNFTIAKYLTPSGIDIEHKGIEPDYEVDYKGNEESPEKDTQLKKAIEVLLGEIRKTKAA